MQVFFSPFNGLAFPPQNVPATASAQTTVPASSPQPYPGAGFSNPFSVFGNPYQSGGAAASGHTVVNDTNALASNPSATQGGAPGSVPTGNAGIAGGASFGGAAVLVPAFAPTAFVPAFVLVPVAFGGFPGAFGQAPAAPSQPAPVAPPVSDGTDVSVPPPIDDAVEPVSVDADSSEPDMPTTSVEPDVSVLSRRFSGSAALSFELNLRTREGDEISIVLEREQTFERVIRQNAETDDVLGREWIPPDRESAFSFTVNGDLSDTERASIDALLENVFTVSEAFYRGDDAGVANALSSLQLDGETLTEVSLSLAVTQRVEVLRGYGQDLGALEQLSNTTGERVSALEFLASEQRRLIDQAQDVFDDGSAVRFVRGTLAQLLDDALGTLEDTLTTSFDAPGPGTRVADATVDGEPAEQGDTPVDARQVAEERAS